MASGQDAKSCNRSRSARTRKLMSHRNSFILIGVLGLLTCALQFQAFGQNCQVQKSGKWTKYSLCFETQSYNAPYYLEFAPDGNLWFSDTDINRLSSAGYE